MSGHFDQSVRQMQPPLHPSAHVEEHIRPSASLYHENQAQILELPKLYRADSARHFNIVVKKEEETFIPEELQPSDGPNSKDDSSNPIWPSDLFAVGHSSLLCVASYLCPCIAMAYTRNRLDGSNFFVNLCCMTPCGLRYMVRTGYGISGDAQSDIVIASCLPPCAINQMAQATAINGLIASKDLGPEYNINPRIAWKKRPCNLILYDFVYAFLCNSCAIGYSLQSAGIPFWFGACCFTTCMTNSIIRYRRRIRPCCDSEFLADGIIPLTAMIGQIPFQILVAPVSWTIVPIVACNLAEENAYYERSNMCYGINACILADYLWTYCSNGCVCHAVEGRYMISEAM